MEMPLFGRGDEKEKEEKKKQRVIDACGEEEGEEEVVAPALTRKPGPTTHDPLAHKLTEKARFYKGDWRDTEPRDWRPHQPERGGE